MSRVFVSVGGLAGMFSTNQFFPMAPRGTNFDVSTFVYIIFLILGFISGALFGLLFKTWLYRKFNF